MPNEPVRSCLLCRSKNTKLGLLRFVRSCDGEIIFDKNISLPGRGVWLCPSYKCINLAFLKKILFKEQKNLPCAPEEMIQKVLNKIKASVLSKFGLLKRIGACEAGRDCAKRLVEKNQAKVIILAYDLTERSRNELSSFLTSTHSKCFVSSDLFSMEEIGNSLGREKTGVVAFLEGRITNELEVDLIRLKSLNKIA
jgi:predicted RNA-binding protein YlxR (DUF448 family)